MDWAHRANNFIAAAQGNPPFCEWLLPPDEVQREYTDPTLIRLRIHVAVFNPTAVGGSTNPPGIGNLSHVGFGVIKWQGIPQPRSSSYAEADDTSLVGGEASVALLPNPCPDPLLDGELDWIWRWTAILLPGSGTGSTVNYNGDTSATESSAMRRLGNDGGILFVVANHTNVENLEVGYDARMLIKE
jgi:hypothetical protein